MGFVWTQERVEKLAQLWKNGDSAAIIGQKIGTSRNAVLGKIHRMRRGGRVIPERTTHSAKVERPRNRSCFKLSRDIPIHYGAIPPRPAPSARTGTLPVGTGLPKHPPMMKRVPFEQTKAHECKFPLWGPDQKSGACCGNLRVPGLPYCRAHQALCHEPMKRSRRRVA